MAVNGWRTKGGHHDGRISGRAHATLCLHVGNSFCEPLIKGSSMNVFVYWGLPLPSCGWCLTSHVTCVS